MTLQGSTVAAGRDVHITASGAGQDSRLTAKGSNITAWGNANLAADNDINLLAKT